ncbi:MAG: FtsX-like permease family protein [Planctomycetes bacterium]|nr:FtsX-like permease family protein [Planctomycetota bacterium]
MFSALWNAAVLKALFWRPAARKPLRLFVTVLGVAVGVASVVATIAASRAAVRAMREGVSEVAGRARLEVTRPGGLEESFLARLRPLTDRALVLPVVEELALVPELGDSVRVLGVDLAVDGAARNVNFRGEFVEAAMPSGSDLFERSLQCEGVLVPAKLASELSVRAGQKLTLLARSRPVEAVVLGVFDPGALATAMDRVVLADVAWAQEAFGRLGRIDRVELLPRAGSDLSALQRDVAAAAPAGARVAAPSVRADSTARMVRSLEFNLTALSGISLLVGAVLVATALATAVVQRRATLALARALGATRGQLAAAVLCEAALLGMGGGALGVVLGAFGARGSLASVRATVAAVVRGVPESAVEVTPAMAAIGVAAGLAVALAASVLPLQEALRTPPVQGLRRERPRVLPRKVILRSAFATALLVGAALLLLQIPAWSDLPIAALGAALALMACVLTLAHPAVDALARAVSRLRMRGKRAPLRIAAASLSAASGRAAWAAGAVGVAVALAIAVSTMVGSFRRTVTDFLEQAIRSDLWVQPVAAETGVQVGRLDPEIVTVAQSIFGAGYVDPFHESMAWIDDRSIALGAGAFDVIGAHGSIPFRDGRSAREVFQSAREGGGVLVNEPLAQRFRVGEGDMIELITSSGTIRKRIEGVFLDYSRSQGAAVLDRAEFLRLYPDDGPESLSIFVPPGMTPEEGRARLAAALAARYRVEVRLNREIRKEALAAFDRTFAITSALQLVTAVVAVIAILAVLSALVDERRRDLALLSALGGERWQVVGVVVAQAGFLGAIGVLLGSGAGFATGWVLVKVVNLQSFGWTLQLLPPWGALGGIAAAVVPACLVAGLAPAAAASRLRPAELLRDDD